MNFVSFPHASFIKKVLGAFFQFWVKKWSCLLLSLDAFCKFSPCKLCKKKNLWVHFYNLCVQKQSCLLWSSGAFWKFLLCEVYEKNLGCIITICAYKNETVCHDVQTHFGSSLPARFAESSGQIFTVYVSINEPVTVKFRCIWKVSACKIDKKVVGAFSRFVCRTNKHSWPQHFVKMLWPHFVILHVHKYLLGCSGTLWSSSLSDFMRMLWIWTHLGYECTHKLWRASVALCKAISQKSWTDTSDMFCNIWTLKEWTDFVKFDLW